MIQNPKRQMTRETSMDLRARAKAAGGLRFSRHTEPHRLEERGKKMEAMEMEKMKREEKRSFQGTKLILMTRSRRREKKIRSRSRRKTVLVK